MNKIYLNDDIEKKFGSFNSTRELALKIKSQIKDDDILFIYLNLKFNNRTRVSQYGIELLIWLRLFDVMNHCVLISFETVHSLLNRMPNHLIATSIGTSFVQLPIDLNDINVMKLINKKAEINNIKTCLKSAFDNTELRHRFANIYGIWFLFNTHNDYFPEDKLDNSILPLEFHRKFNDLQLEIGRFLFQRNLNSNSSNSIVNNIKKIKKRIEVKQPKILYIDDKANLGWGSLFKHILFSPGDQYHFDIIIPKLKDFETDNNFYALVQEVCNRIYNDGNYIDCVLLDLRLADEEGEIINLEKLSGIRMLYAIHKKFPSLPIIITTASNKADTVKKVFRYGVEAFWTKPGLDSSYSEMSYLRDYYELLLYTENALYKYTDNTEKYIVKAQFELSHPRKFDGIPNQLQEIDIILTDTNVWCETTSELVKNHIVLYNLAKAFKEKGKQFILIDDVLNELFIISQKTHKVGLRKAATYSIGLIQQYKNEFLFESSFEEVKNAIKKSTNYIKQLSKGGGYHIVSNTTKVHSYHQTQETAEEELNDRKKSGHFSLHADDTFKLLVTYFLNQQKNVLFVSNDKKCKIETLNTLRYLSADSSSNWEIPKTFNINTGNLTIRSQHKSFCMMVSTDVLHKICYPEARYSIKKLILPISIT